MGDGSVQIRDVLRKKYALSAIKDRKNSHTGERCPSKRPFTMIPKLVHKMSKNDRIQSRVTPFYRSSGNTVIAVIATTLCLFCANSLRAQQRVRTAQGRLEIESFKNPLIFFRLGPLQEELLGSAGFEYTDNSGLSNTNKISRFRLSQGL